MSNLHCKVERELAKKVKLAFRFVVVFFGFDLIVVSGGVVSFGPGSLITVNDLLAGLGSMFPEPSVARTLKVWAPGVRVPVV